VSPGAEGNILGHLRLTFEQGRLSEYRNEFKSFEYLKDPDDPAVRQRIEDYTKKLKERLKKK
jgi:2',3'-cyclic-nucleotide 2'-phosphodiesterase (5'-nucleotidase family)